MSFVLFEMGRSRPPRTAKRRIMWMIVTLVPLAVIAGLMTAGAVSNWIALDRGAVPAPGLGDTIGLTVCGGIGLLVFVVVLVLGVRRVREQRVTERTKTRP